ncbi:MAG: hypothetical protein HYW25_01505 [Candidatus Aenigmarchaeota archaeon]|nr:hypothetical protein [Candidatus Aenigmarchaeota archaeon]
MTYYDLHVHVRDSGGENSADDIISMASKLGLSGVGIVLHAEQGFDSFDEYKKKGEKAGIDIVSVALAQAKNVNDIKRLVAKTRSKAEIVAVYGGDYDINRAACENPMVDILFHPERGRIDSGIDHICARAAAENEVAIEINFHELLESYRKKRIRVFARMIRNVMLCGKFGAKTIATSGSISKWDMRFGRELAAIPYLLGEELGKSIESASTIPEDIVKKNREKLAGKKWEGVAVVEDLTQFTKKEGE